jgi:hypothetical protein
MIKFAPYQLSVIIGVLLSDGWLIFASSTHKNARLGLKQSLAHFEFLLFVFNILSHYCASILFLDLIFEPPSGRHPTNLRLVGRDAGKRNFSLEFSTRALPCFTELHSLFYPNGIKVIPQNIYRWINLNIKFGISRWINLNIISETFDSSDPHCAG